MSGARAGLNAPNAGRERDVARFCVAGHRYVVPNPNRLHRLVTESALQPSATSRRAVRAGAVDAPEQSASQIEEREAVQSRWTPEQFAGLWSSCTVEESFEVTDVEGRIPNDLQGTWYRNGPGMFELGGQPMHVFDGHGLVCRLAFSDGIAHFASRYVRTPAYVEETSRNRVLYRGFGTTKPGGTLANLFDIRDKPVANTSLAEWNGKLWALWEAHRPFVLDPTTLETFGEETLGGFLFENQAFCAHPQLDPDSGRLCVFSLGLRFAEGKLRIFELEPDGTVERLKVLGGIFNPITYVHDFAVTKSWYVFFRPPLKANMAKLAGYVVGMDDQTKMVEFDSDKPGCWLLISREEDGPIVEIKTPPQFLWHYAGASEDPVTGVLTVDACIFDKFSPGAFDLRDPSTMDRSILCRCKVDPQQKTATRTELVHMGADFPTRNPAFAGRADYRYVYMAACTEPGKQFPFQSIVKVDLQAGKHETWDAPAGCFVGEAVFVPRRGPSTLQSLQQAAASEASRGDSHHLGGSNGSSSSTTSSGNRTNETDSHTENGNCNGVGMSSAAQHQRSNEDDGYLITPVFDGVRKRSSVVILNAKELAAGPVAQLYFKTIQPFAFHCLWSNTYYGPV